MLRKGSLLLAALLATNFAAAQWVWGLRPKKPVVKKPAVSTTVKPTKYVQPTVPAISQKVAQQLAQLAQQPIVLETLARAAREANKVDALRYLAKIQPNIVVKSLVPDPTFLAKILTEDVTITDPEVYYEAIYRGNLASLALLCERTHPSATRKYYMFYEALRRDNLEIAQTLLDMFGLDINAYPESTEPLLLKFGNSSYEWDKEDAVRRLNFLLKNGADPNLVLDTGYSVYLTLLLNPKFAYPELLEKYGAKLEGEMLEKANLELHNAIHVYGRTVQLVEAGADPNFKKDGMTPLERAKRRLSQIEDEFDSEAFALRDVIEFYESLSDAD